MIVKASEIKNMRIKCSEHTKLGRAAGSQKGRRAIQRELDKLEKKKMAQQNNRASLLEGKFGVQAWAGRRHMNTGKTRQGGDPSLRT